MPRLVPEILWEDGMLLSAHHMQAFQRHCIGLINHHAQTRPFSYGIRKLDILKEGIGNWLFEVAACDVIMPEGSVLISGRTVVIETEEFRHLKHEGPVLEVWLALPLIRDEGRNVLVKSGQGGDTEHGAGVRYIEDSESLHDETSGGNTRDIGIKRFNARLFIGNKPPGGYSTMKIAELKKVIKDDDSGGRYELSDRFVPPCLTMDSSPQLSGILKDLLNRLEEKNSELLTQLKNRADLLSGETTDPATLLKLQATNGVLPLLRQLAGQKSMHPFDVYLTLTRLIGDLAIFSKEWAPPKLILYDHDDPLKAFQDLKNIWVDLLDVAVQSDAAQVPFSASPEIPDAVVADLSPSFLEEQVDLYLCAYTDKDPAEAIPILERVRLAAPGHLADYRRRRISAIQCQRESKLHPALREREGQVFLRIDKIGTAWETACSAGRLALDTRTVGGVSEKFVLYATSVKREF